MLLSKMENRGAGGSREWGGGLKMHLYGSEGKHRTGFVSLLTFV